MYNSNYKSRNINGLVSKTEVLDPASPTTVKAKTEITYDGVSLLDETESTRWENPGTNYRGLVTQTRSWHDIAGNQYSVTGHTNATRDLRPEKEVSIIFEPGNSNALATMSETVYDTSGNSDPAYFSSLNPEQQKKYHYVTVSASTASTASVTDAIAWFNGQTAASLSEMEYLYNSNYKSRNINGLVSETKVLNPASPTTVKAKTEITYDGVSLLNETESTRWENPGTNYRGLVTKTRSWHDIAGNQFIETNAQYDLMGNLKKRGQACNIAI